MEKKLTPEELTPRDQDHSENKAFSLNMDENVRVDVKEDEGDEGEKKVVKAKIVRMGMEEREGSGKKTKVVPEQMKTEKKGEKLGTNNVQQSAQTD